MGSSSSSSSSKSNSNSSCKQTQIRGKRLKSDTASQELVEKKMDTIEASLKTDASMPNLVTQFANILEIEGMNKMDCVTRIVHSMGSEWRTLMKEEGRLRKAVGADEVQNLKDIRGEYFFLLLKTKTVVVGLMEESEIQKEHVANSLAVVNKALNNDEGVLSSTDRLVYDESMAGLFEWIDQTDLIAITKEWNQLCARMEAQKSRFTKLWDKYNNKTWWTKALACISALVCAGSSIALSIATGGVAIIVAGCICIGAEVFAVGALAYGHFLRPKDMERIKQITHLLNQYIKNGHSVEHDIGEMQAINNKIKKRVKFSKTVCRLIDPQLRKIDGYLDTYVQSGTIVVNEIEVACEEFITK